ncbi:DNA-binding Xre family transcriptional regulator [Paenibacillus taihuensis]|uniref:DNA-binding Xre family transcriptional regulator n=1 Tax=Paenibacillus taihuensis TaxID=1156355 RepID=A0A3D9RQS3_9BACL|nr:helix-turn-helix transcriptional regulator [Paenibacillus taihuensis]REE78785.1 DNA-binding Xre family transcriptional regulator [Paenibacillus taihuensis]
MSLFAAVFHTLKTPLAVITGQGASMQFDRVNKAFSDLVGCSEVELQGLPPSRLFSPWNEQLLLAADKSEIFTLRQSSLPRDPQHLLLTIDEVVDTAEPAYLLTAEDISARTWIESMSKTERVLQSGILNEQLVIERYYRSSASPILDPNLRIEAESLQKFFDDSDRERLVSALKQATLHQRMDQIVVRTKPLANNLQLELHITFRPFFNGDKSLLHYGFIITNIHSLSEPADPSVTLKVLMTRNYISAQQLSHATGISLQTISKLRNGKIGKPQRQTALLIASQLNVLPQDIWP